MSEIRKHGNNRMKVVADAKFRCTATNSGKSGMLSRDHSRFLDKIKYGSGFISPESRKRSHDTLQDTVMIPAFSIIYLITKCIQSFQDLPQRTCCRIPENLLTVRSVRAAFLFLALIIGLSQTALSQWELMHAFNAAPFTGMPGVARNEQRIVGVLRNKEVYESRPDSISWRLLTVLPKEIRGGTIRGIHLSPTNEIYVCSGHDLYRYEETSRSWQCLTTSLQMHPLAKMVDVAIKRDGTIFLMYRGSELFRSVNNGATWSIINDARPSLNSGNQLQISPEGTLYVNTEDGLYKSQTDGITLLPVVPGINLIRFGSSFPTNNPYIVVNDTTIWGVTDDGDLYTLDHRVPAWRLVRKGVPLKQMFPRFGVGDGGVLYYLYSGLFGINRTIDWSTDAGVTWSNSTTRAPDVGCWFSDPDVLYGDAHNVLIFENLWEGGEVYEVNLATGVTEQRAAMIARSYAFNIFQSKNYIGVHGQEYLYFYNKHTGITRPNSVWTKRNHWLKDNDWFYFQPHPDPGTELKYGILQQEHPFLDVYYTIINCAPERIVIDSRGDILEVAEGYFTTRNDSLCETYSMVSMFAANHIAINRDDRFVVANKLGEFEYYDENDVLLSKGRLEPFIDSVRWIQNDTRGNLVFLGITSAYYSGDYGATWARSTIPGEVGAMQKVLVDHNVHFYALDATDGVYWSRDAGASFVRLPIDFDSLFCGVTDIVVDKEYLYCSTSGCGVYRMALPSLNGLESVRPIAQTHTPINLYIEREPMVTIPVPFELDRSTSFRMTDINGRMMNEVMYTVEIPHATLQVQTSMLPSGVYPFMISSTKDATSGKLIIRR